MVESDSFIKEVSEEKKINYLKHSISLNGLYLH